MQAVSCGSPLVTLRGMTTSKVEKPEIANPLTERLMSNVRLAAIKPDLGTPMRVPVDPNGQRFCPTPKGARSSSGMKTHAFGPQELSEVHDLRQPDLGKSTDLENPPTTTPNFTMYSNPAFEPLETFESPTKLQKQPPCIPVDSNGQRLCPTPKSTLPLSSPGASKFRFPKGTSFQPLETIQSPIVSKDQTKRVLGDSNGQWMQETPKLSKQCTTPRARSTAFDTKCSENMTPRALFYRSLGDPTAPSAVEVHLAGGSKVKKRARGEDDPALSSDITRATRSKTEAEKIARFLRSPAARVRPDGTREDYRLGVSDLLVKQFTEKKMAMKKSCQCDTMKKPCFGCDDSIMEESSLNIDSVNLKAPVSKQLLAVQESPSARIRVQSPGLGRSSLLRSPLVTSSKKQSEKEIPASRNGKPTPQGSAKKNLSVLLEAET